MRTTGLSALAALSRLHFLSANAAVTCHTDHPLTSWSVSDLSKLKDALTGPVTGICSNTERDEIITHEPEGIIFQITRTTAQSQDECMAAFSGIIAQCIISQNVEGGEIDGANGTIYSIYHGNLKHDEFEEFHELDARAKKPKPKPKTEKTKTTKKPKATAKDTAKSMGSGKAKATATTSSTKTGPTKSCKQMYALAAKAAKVEALQNERSKAVAKRDDHVGGMATFKKRTAKSGTSTCGRTFGIFNALDYPSVKEMPKGAKYYHFQNPETCESLAFVGSTTVAKELVQSDYQIEHVLEWQVVTNFFKWVSEKKTGKVFPNPDPRKLDKDKNRQMMGFCDYLDVTWGGSFVPSFKLKGHPGGEDEARTAQSHMAFAYPSKKHFKDEFIYLQTTVNAPAKQQMWDSKATLGIYGDTTKYQRGKAKLTVGMSDLIRGHRELGKGKIPAKPANIDDARKAYLKLKFLYGARKYLQDKEIEAIFKKQVERMGTVLDLLDAEMENRPKETRTGLQDAWKKQGLEALWTEYMNDEFKRAKSRTTNDMDKYIRLLENVWSPRKGKAGDKDHTLFFAQIQKLKTTWAAEKAATWNAPW